MPDYAHEVGDLVYYRYSPGDRWRKKRARVLAHGLDMAGYPGYDLSGVGWIDAVNVTANVPPLDEPPF